MTDITTLDRSDVSTPKMQDTLLAYVFFGIEAAQVIHDTYDSSPAGHLAVIGALMTKATPVNPPGLRLHRPGQRAELQGRPRRVRPAVRRRRHVRGDGVGAEVHDPARLQRPPGRPHLARLGVPRVSCAGCALPV